MSSSPSLQRNAPPTATPTLKPVTTLVVCRKFTDEDATSAADLLSESREEYVQWFHPFAFDRDTIARLALHNDRDQWFALEIVQGNARRFAGFYMLRGVDEGFADPMYGVFIAENFSRKGLGRFTISHAETQCRLNHWPTLLLKVSPQNRRAFELYRRVGFHTARIDPTHGEQVMAKSTGH